MLLLLLLLLVLLKGFSGGSAVKNKPANSGDVCSIPGLGRSPGGRNGNPLQYSCLENSMDRGVWWATVHGVTKTWTKLSAHTCMERHQKTMVIFRVKKFGEWHSKYVLNIQLKFTFIILKYK